MSILIKGLDMPNAGEMLYIDIYPTGKVSNDFDLECKEIAVAVEIKTLHGRWKGQGMGDYRCSLCEFVVSGNGYRFCPACGARMDKEG